MTSSTKPKWPRSDIAVIVLPPGHGKSYYHGKLEGLIEADTLVPCRSTIPLDMRRTLAKLYGNWEDYDDEWRKELKLAMPAGPVVLMIPSHEVNGDISEALLLTGVLSLDQWAKNLENRKGSVEEYREWREKVMKGPHEVFETNEDLEKVLLARSKDWLENLANLK